MSQLEGFGAPVLQMSPPHNRLAANHQSNSLPSTPYQRARKLSFNARSPSPEKIAGTRSPTAHSESESGQRPRVSGPLLAGCKYETGMAFSRRRIPYSIGGDQLPRAKTMPKKYLNPVEEGKLSGDMRELYDRLYPSLDSDERRSHFVEKLGDILNKQWPGNNIRVHVFGSSGNLLCTDESDVDICITTPSKALERVCLLAKTLAEHGMQRVVCVPHAKVPIVKFWDPELQLACDMNVNNTLALENTRMIKTYVEIDHRVRPLAMIIKHWTRRRILNDAALGGTLSSYTWICMILNFLQTRNPPVLPCLHKRPHQRLLGADGKPSAFADDLASLRGFGHKNKESLGELLFHFFRRYAHELDYERNVISIREGTLISKEDKKWHLMQNNRLCVEEPFNTERNLGNTADDISFRGVHLELRRAFDLISEAKLNDCMEQFVFPAMEEKIWEKPPPKPPPVLSRSQSQSGRGGRGGANNRGGRHALNHQRNGPQGRRASSTAAPNKIPTQTTMPRTVALWEQPLQAPYDQYQLHERLISDYQLLQAQEHELRRVQAQAQLQAQLQFQGSSQNPHSAHQAAREHFALQATKLAPLTAPLHTTHSAMPFPQILRSHPPSPAMQSAQPELRRSIHRSIPANNSSGAGNRSHSQPARTLPLTLPVPNYLQQCYPLRDHQIHHYLESHSRLRHPEAPVQIDSRFEESLPKEYVGYYVHGSPPSRTSQNDIGYSRRPTLGDMPHRNRGMPYDLGRYEDPSGSPPSTPYRDRSTSIRSAPVTIPAPSLRTSGPIIVDGSDAWAPDENTRGNLPSDGGTINGIDRISQMYSSRSPLLDEQYQRSGRSETISSMPFKQPFPFHLASSSHARVDNVRSPNPEQMLRRAYPQVNGTAPAPVTAQFQPITVNDYELGTERSHDGTPKSRPRSPQRDVPAASPIQSPSTGKHDMKSEPPPLQGLPLLSPVREVRTPSPTANRKDDITGKLRPLNRLAQKYAPGDIPPFSRRSEKKNEQLEQPVFGLNGLSVASSSNVQAGQLTNGWQQTTSKKNKKNRGKFNGPQSIEMPLVEPMPTNEAERKGG